MGLKTVAQQIAEEERGESKKSESSKSIGVTAPMVVLLIGLVIVVLALMPQILANQTVYAVVPGGSVSRLTSLAYQQQQLSYAMTQQAGQISANTAAAQMSTQQAMSNGATQQALQVWNITQTPLAATQIVENLKLQKTIDEYNLGRNITPVKVYGTPALIVALCTAALLLSIIAAALLLPEVKAKMQVIKEERGERTFIRDRDKGTLINTALLERPIVQEQPDGTVKTLGGFEDPLLQAGVVDQAAKTKMIQALPVGARLPGHKIDALKAPPDIEVIDAKVTDQKLLNDARSAVEGEEV